MKKEKKRAPNPYLFDDYRQQIPYYYYKRFRTEIGTIPVANLPMNNLWSFRLTQGYTYLLRSYAAKWSGHQEGSPGDPLPDVLISFYNKIRATNYQTQPFPARLVTTPGGQGVWAATAHAPVDQDAFGVVLTEKPLKNILTQNLFYQFNDNVYMEINYPVTIVENEYTYLDLVLFGYLIPEKDLEMWK